MLWWYNNEERKRQEKGEAVNEAERDMKSFNYYVAHAIRIEFEEILHFSENALRNIFTEIRKSERKRVTINNFYPTIEAIHEGKNTQQSRVIRVHKSVGGNSDSRLLTADGYSVGGNSDSRLSADGYSVGGNSDSRLLTADGYSVGGNSDSRLLIYIHP